MPKTHPHEGTFGGSPAADALDSILCGVNNEGLIQKIGRIISWATTMQTRLRLGVSDQGLRAHLIGDFRKAMNERIDRLDYMEFVIPPTKMDTIKTFTKNVAWTILRQANKNKV